MRQKDRPSIAIVDFGGQYTHLIAKRIRSLGVYTHICQPEQSEFAPCTVGIVLSGGPRSVTVQERYDLPWDMARTPLPILGICYGHQLIASLLGGNVERGSRKEYGRTSVTCDPAAVLFRDLQPTQTVWMSHGDHVVRLPEGFRATARSRSGVIAAAESADRRIMSTQFHPEVTHTINGMAMLDRFVSRCTADRSWNPTGYVEEIRDRIREEAGTRRLFLLVSGGVDSLVTLTLCNEAVGRGQVFPLHVDTGFMRLRESEEIEVELNKLGHTNLMVEQAAPLFLSRLEDCVDPEEKRLIIGGLFVEVLHRKLRELSVDDHWMLVQGTIYPDTIESGGTAKAARIKTHHNRVEEIEQLIAEGLVIEPLRDLYKDEVRALGRELGLPEHLLRRHPFPGPGLAIRIIASDTDVPPPDYDREAPRLDALCGPFGMAGRILPIRSVGVQGDSRTYHHPAVIWRAEEPPDHAIDWHVLQECALVIINRLDTVNRVVFSPEPLTRRLLLRPLRLTPDSVERLRTVDSRVCRKIAPIDDIWQIPVVSLPLFDEVGRQAFVMRPICSRDAMTADVYHMAPELLSGLIGDVRSLPWGGYLFYDITTKPPATIEWE